MSQASIHRATLRKRIAGPGICTFPGTGDALGARLIEAAGFDGIYMSGYAVETSCGKPDVGLLGMSEMVRRAEEICDVASVPVIADSDTGYGGIANLQRTVRSFGRAGVSGIQLEDQALPKKCGSMAGKSVVSKSEMVGKIQAACDAREDDGMLIIGRSDALAIEGVDLAVERLNAYYAAGADMVMMLGPYDEASMRAFLKHIDGPLAHLNSESFTMPMLPVSELESMGVKLAIFPLSLTLAAARAMQAALDVIRAHGTTVDVARSTMMSWADCNAATGLDAIREAEIRFENN